MKEKVIVWGATESANELYEKIEEQYEIINYCDNDSSKWGDN